MTIRFWDDFKRDDTTAPTLDNLWTAPTNTNGNQRILAQALTHTSTASGANIDARRSIGSSQPTYVRFKIRTSTSAVGSVFYLQAAASPIAAWADVTLAFSVRIAGTALFTGVANTWYTFEFKNIDYINSRYDGYVDGVYYGVFNFLNAGTTPDIVRFNTGSTGTGVGSLRDLLVCDTEPERLELKEDFFYYGSASANIYGVNYESMVFRAQSDAQVSALNIWASRLGNPATVTFQLRNVSAGLPGGTVLATGTYDGNSVPATPSFGSIVVPLSATVQLTRGTQYALVISAPSGDVSNQFYWHGQASVARSWASRAFSTNSGSSWTANATFNMGFQLYKQNFGRNEFSGWWRLETGTNDFHGTTNGTASGATPTGAQFPPFAIGSYNFVSASSQYVDLGITNKTNLGGDLTLSAWIRPTAFNGNNAIISNYNAGGTRCQYQLKLTTAGALVYNIQNLSGEQTYTTGYTPTLNVWTHIVAVIKNNSLTIYANGAAIAGPTTVAARPVTGFGNTAVGRGGSFAGIYFDGQICQVITSPTAMTATEVQTLYNSGNGQRYFYYAPMTDRLTAYYTLDAVTTDSTSNGIVPSVNGPVSDTANGNFWFGSAYNWDGVDDNIQIPADVTNNRRAGSISVWAKGTVAATQYNLFAKASAVLRAQLGGAGPHSIYFNTGGEPGNVFSTANITSTVWNHYLFTWGDRKRTYVNGVLVLDEQSFNPTPTSGTLYLGQNSVNNTETWGGNMDEWCFFDRELTQAEALRMYNRGAGRRFDELANQHPLIEGCLDYQSYDGGVLVWARQHFGSVTNTGTTSTTGKIGTGRNFVRASSQYITIPAHALPLTNGLSIAAWVKPASLPTSMIIFRQDPNGGTGWNPVLGLSSNNAAFNELYFGDDAGFREDLARTAATGVWTHVLGTMASGAAAFAAINLYKNGAVIGSTNTFGTFNGVDGTAQTMHIGVQVPPTASFYDGDMDELAIWFKELSQPEANALYNATNGFAYPFAYPAPTPPTPTTSAMFFGGAL